MGRTRATSSGEDGLRLADVVQHVVFFTDMLSWFTVEQTTTSQPERKGDSAINTHPFGKI
jgi:hypothetical protein